MKSKIATIAVDIMGGDVGVKATLPALIEVAKLHKQFYFYCVGLESEALTKVAGLDNVEFVAATEVVSMQDSPAYAVRHKKNSSMRVAIDLVKTGKADACVSSGNTGALMAIAHFRLKMMSGISRPAIMSALPTCLPNKFSRVLDLGANVLATPEHLYEFSILGAAAAIIDGVDNPQVGLLNVGQEQHKGNDNVKLANELLKQVKGMQYVGYVEGDQIFDGSVDVIVCDGFVGNVLLKSCEGLIKSVGVSLKQSCKSSLKNSLVALLAKYSFSKVISNYHPDNHNGALLAGLSGVVVKSHGNASVEAFKSALLRSMALARGSGFANQVSDLVSLNAGLACIQD